LKLKTIASVLFFSIFSLLSHAENSMNLHNEKMQRFDIRYLTVPEDKVYSERFLYIEDLIHLVMNHSGADYSMRAVTVKPVPTSRNVMFLKNDLFNVLWIHTDTHREKELRPIRYPIFRGLIGWRLFLIDRRKQDLLKSLASIDELKNLKCGQGHDWPDTKILNAAGFNMRTSFSWEGIHNLLANNRIDLFPRSVIEIWNEKANIDASIIGSGNKNFSSVEESIALKYPTAFYLYVTKKNEKLAQALEKGFEAAIRDGTFNALFMRYFGNSIHKSKLKQRRIFEINNPLLPNQTPVNRKALWFSIDDLK